LTKPISDEAESVVAGSIKSIGGKAIWDVGEERMNSKKYLGEAPTMNMAFKKEIIKKVGFFDEKFNYGSDVDFTWRATDLGYKIRYNKDAIIYHDWGNLQQEIKRSFSYGEGRTRLYKKHPGRWKNLFGYDMIILIYPLYIIFLPLTFFWPYYPLLILIPIIKNIKRQPLKVVCSNLIYGFGVLKELFFLKKWNQ
jgi:GT2 family glycosyltransferase